MANGTHDENIARADRIAEQSEKAQAKAEQSRQATQNAIAAVRGSKLPSITDEDEVSEAKIEAPFGKAEFKGRVPSWAWAALIVLAGIGALAVGLAEAWRRMH